MTKGTKLPEVTFTKPEPKVKGAKGKSQNEQRRPSSVARISLMGIHRTLQGLEHAIAEGCSFDAEYAAQMMHVLNHQVAALQIAVKKAKEMDMVLNVNPTQVDSVKNRVINIRSHLEAAF